MGVVHEPEPLAFRVRPRPNEAFDSWMDRLTAKHEVTRAELFRHLDCEPRLGLCDLARGWQGMGEAHYPAFHQLIETLAWAVQARTRTIEATFVSVPEATLLPPALRVFGCPLCWRGSLQAGEPLILTRDWILRASWMCQRHRLPLVAVRRLVHGRTPRAAARILDVQVAAMQSLRRRYPSRSVMLAFNRSVIDAMLGDPGAGLRRGEFGYRSRFTANRFHLADARIALLTAAHSDRTCSADRFEELVGLSASALLRSSANLLKAKARRPVVPSGPFVPEGLLTRRVNRWQTSLSDLIEAYVQVKRRDTTACCGGSQGQNGDLAEICPQNPAERIGGLSAPLPIGDRVFAL